MQTFLLLKGSNEYCVEDDVMMFHRRSVENPTYTTTISSGKLNIYLAGTKSELSGVKLNHAVQGSRLRQNGRILRWLFMIVREFFTTTHVCTHKFDDFFIIC